MPLIRDPPPADPKRTCAQQKFAEVLGRMWRETKHMLLLPEVLRASIAQDLAAPCAPATADTSASTDAAVAAAAAAAVRSAGNGTAEANEHELLAFT